MKLRDFLFIVLLDGGLILCSSYKIARTLGRDKLQGDAEEDSVGCHADGQPALREQAAGGGSLAGANGDETRTYGICGTHRRRVGGTATGTKGTLIEPNSTVLPGS